LSKKVTTTFTLILYEQKKTTSSIPIKFHDGVTFVALEKHLQTCDLFFVRL